MEEVMANRDARCAYVENKLRSKLAGEFDEARQDRGLSIRGLAKAIGTSLSQVQRLLHREVGGSLTLGTFVRAADALGLTLGMTARHESSMSPARLLRPTVTAAVVAGTGAYSKHLESVAALTTGHAATYGAIASIKTNEPRFRETGEARAPPSASSAAIDLQVGAAIHPDSWSHL